ncbi:hypothetical protein ASG01_12225 [Chryseobacterium sp. Leaf180]|uniref:hypothetical protein n=1 Tax=Chryseobacterium sp. Leaf180 TaxID=1736289 RepID=UPI0006F54732|nr:hypothetical protein [Chryseobacterium sp. Leaf180]KQR92657.1 hypothetical protein ASG01_12225 [Chryseobacterium sp. Leaf180]
MKTPFYLSYTEFEKNYYNLLEQWFEEHYNTSEQDFLKNISDLYKPYISYNDKTDALQINDFIEVKNCFFANSGNFGIAFNENGTTKTKIPIVSEVRTITMMEYAQVVLDKIHLYFQKNDVTMKENESILDYINDRDIITMKESNGFCIDFHKHQKTLPFLHAFLPKFGNTVDISLYRSFYSSAAKIADFIDFKMQSMNAFEESLYCELKSKSLIKVHLQNRNYLTVLN